MPKRPPDRAAMHREYKHPRLESQPERLRRRCEGNFIAFGKASALGFRRQDDALSQDGSRAPTIDAPVNQGARARELKSDARQRRFEPVPVPNVDEVGDVIYEIRHRLRFCRPALTRALQ